MTRFEEVTAEVGELVAKKNATYGDSFAKCGEFLALLFPDGIEPEQYRDALALVRIFDKMMRIATDPTAFGEDPWRDIAGYAVLSLAAREKPAVSEEDSEREFVGKVARVIAEHTHDNNPMREALRKCVGSG